MATTLAGCDAMNGLVHDGQLSYGVPAGRPRLVEVEGTLTDLDGHCLREVRRMADAGVPLGNMAILYREGQRPPAAQDAAGPPGHSRTGCWNRSGRSGPGTPAAWPRCCPAC